jgi:hypothetical protein
MSRYTEQELNPKPALLGSIGRGALVGSAIIGRHALFSKSPEDTLRVRLGVTAGGGVMGGAMGAAMHPIRVAVWRAQVNRQRKAEKGVGAGHVESKSAAYELGVEMGTATKRAAENADSRRTIEDAVARLLASEDTDTGMYATFSPESRPDAARYKSSLTDLMRTAAIQQSNGGIHVMPTDPRSDIYELTGHTPRVSYWPDGNVEVRWDG